MAFIPIADTNPLRHIKRPWVAWSIIAANVVIYFGFELGGFIGDVNESRVVSYGLIPAVFNGLMPRPVDLAAVPDALTLITYAFLHADLWHLLGNMIFLWVFADNVEDSLGHFRFVIFYTLCAIAGGYAFVLSDPTSNGPVIGASGAIAGVVAAYFLLHPSAKIWILLFARIPIKLSALWVLGFWIGFQFLAVFLPSEGDNVAWWSHVGGLLTGAVLVVFLRRPGVKLFDRHPVPTVVAVPPATLNVVPAPVDDPGKPPIGSPPAQDSRGPWG